MPQTNSYAASFRSEVSRLAKKEAKALLGPVAKELIKAKKVISAQRKELAELQRSLNVLTKVVKKQAAFWEPVGAGRFVTEFRRSPDLLCSQRGNALRYTRGELKE